MSAINFPSNPAENQLFEVSTARSFKRVGGAWVLFRNNPPEEGEVVQPSVKPIVSATTPALPNTNPFWDNTADGKLYFQQSVDGVMQWSAASETDVTAVVVSQSSAPTLPNSVPFWHDSDTGIIHYQKTIGGNTTWQALNSLERYDLNVVSSTGAIDASATQVIKIDNSTATTKTVNITNAPVGRAMTFVIKITGKAGTVNYANTVVWSGGSAPVLGNTYTLVALFWDGTAFTGGVTQTA